MTDLSEIFAKQESNVVDWNGAPVYGLIDFDKLPSNIHLTFISAKASPVQGIQMRIRGGTLVAGGHDASDVVFWKDTAPTSVSVEVLRRGRGKAVLKLWNVWRGGHDVTQAWLGNAAIQVEGDMASGSFRIRCSDGNGEPNFDDLIVGVEVE